HVVCAVLSWLVPHTGCGGTEGIRKGRAPESGARPLLLLVCLGKNYAVCAYSIGCSFTDSSIGRVRLLMTSAFTTHLRTFSSDGISYMTSSRTSSIVVRSPRAPVLRSCASLATASSASSVTTSSTSSRLKNFWYCLTTAFFGSTRMRISSSVVR